MAKQKARSLDAGLLKPEKKPAATAATPADDKPVAMTLKLPAADYVRLKKLAAERRTKGQALMLEAVREYLDRTA
jgi:hypothetical protein